MTTTPIAVSGTERVTVVLESAGPSAPVSGLVSDAGGRPVAGAWVFLIPEDPALAVVASPAHPDHPQRRPEVESR